MDEPTTEVPKLTVTCVWLEREEVLITAEATSPVVGRRYCSFTVPTSALAGRVVAVTVPELLDFIRPMSEHG